MSMISEADKEGVTTLWDTIKQHGLSYSLVGLYQRICKQNERIAKLEQDSQDLRTILHKIRTGLLEDQVYAEVQRVIVENRNVIEANDNDVWNINQRVDRLQKQILEIQAKL